MNGSFLGLKTQSKINIKKIINYLYENINTKINGFSNFIPYRIKSCVINGFSGTMSILNNSDINYKVIQHEDKFRIKQSYNQTFYYDESQFFSIKDNLNRKENIDAEEVKKDMIMGVSFNEFNVVSLSNIKNQGNGPKEIIKEISFSYGVSWISKFYSGSGRKNIKSKGLISFILNLISSLKSLINFFFNKLFNYVNLGFYYYTNNACFSLDLALIFKYSYVDITNYRRKSYFIKINDYNYGSIGFSAAINFLNEIVDYKDIADSLDLYRNTQDAFFNNIYKKNNLYIIFFKIKFNFFFNRNPDSKVHLELLFFYWTKEDVLLNKFLSNIHQGKLKTPLNAIKTLNFVNVLYK
jgi:hypothetical protein